jgi:hypothetical protein
MNILAVLTIICSLLSLLSLLILHFVSPEFSPRWRMVSEYALGRHKWLITSFFLFWGISSLMLSVLLWNVVTSKAALFGVVLLFISGIGEIMGGLFDINHKKHGLAFALGIPTLPAAALLIGYNLVQMISVHRSEILMASHASWISLVLMAAAMGVMLSGFKKAGIPMGPDAKPLERVPNGVIALAGYANRILVGCYVLWLIVIAKIVSSL